MSIVKTGPDAIPLDAAPLPYAPFVIEAGRANKNYWRDIWGYRELFAILAWRDVAVRYKQTVIGVAWAVVRPFLTMVIFTLIFGKLAKLRKATSAPTPKMTKVGRKREAVTLAHKA